MAPRPIERASPVPCADFIKALKAAGVNATLYGGDALSTQRLAQLAGASLVKGMRVTDTAEGGFMPPLVLLGLGDLEAAHMWVITARTYAGKLVRSTCRWLHVDLTAFRMPCWAGACG